jgi:glucuronosyltransferase
MSPGMPWVSQSKLIHLPYTFSYIPDCCIGVTNDMSFVERLKNTVTGVIKMYVENYLYIAKIESIMNKHFTYQGWESRPPLHKMFKHVYLTLVNGYHAIGVCRPYLPDVVEVGGLHIKKPKEKASVNWLTCLN